MQSFFSNGFHFIHFRLQISFRDYSTGSSCFYRHGRINTLFDIFSNYWSFLKVLYQIVVFVYELNEINRAILLYGWKWNSYILLEQKTVSSISNKHLWQIGQHGHHLRNLVISHSYNTKKKSVRSLVHLPVYVSQIIQFPYQSLTIIPASYFHIHTAV